MKLQFRHRCLPIIVGIISTIWLTGCETRSISDSGYRGASPYGSHLPASDSGFKGELSEFDVLGVQRDGQITEEQIGKALDAAARVRLRKGCSLLLIQSGAYQPDHPMTHALAKNFNVVPFDGRPETKSDKNPETYAKALRLAAARAGCEAVICYWGTLESARRNLESKSVSWVPVVGWVLPDERQHMRIRLKVAIVDVRSGNWTMFSPEAFDHRALSSMFNKEASDQGQVDKLKQSAYESAASDLAKLYTN